MNTLLNTLATAIVLTTVTAGSALACNPLESEAKVLTLQNDQQKEMTVTVFDCDEVDAVAEELELRVTTKKSVLNKIVKITARPFKSTPAS